MSETRIVVADDHTLVRQSITKLLDSCDDLAVVAEAATGEQALDMIRVHAPDVAVLDVSMPGMDGLDVAVALRRDAPNVRILMLTMHDDDVTLRRATQTAVDGYLSKTASTDEVIAAVRSVAAGGAYVSPTIASRMMRLASGTGAGANLTTREVEILRLLAHGSRIQDIAKELFLSTKTVKNHLTNVYAKLGVDTAAQAVAEAYRTGIVSTS
jgi:DNA-binding NarL/FixJ family response regulator